MVPRDVIDEIRNRVDIVRLIGEVLPLKKTGRNHLGLCPFHQEKTPSFTVSEPKQLYHCFGCGEGGTVFTFFMKFHRLTFPETLERLAPIAGIDVSKFKGNPAENAARQEERKRLLRVVAYARDLYHRAFLTSEKAERARQYAVSRGISPDQSKELKLGFAPDGWDTLVRALERDQQSIEDAREAGLVGKRQGSRGFFDLFRNRLLFPIQDPQGQTVGFGGRILDDRGADLAPKYLNSPQTPLFDKGRLLYGLYEAIDAIRKEKRVIVVEGYMDQVALVASGIQNVVATLGTALTDSHARLLRQQADEVVVFFDGDAAGLKASRRSIRPLLAEGVKASVAILPNGIDPDVYVRTNGREALLKLIGQAAPVLEFFVDRFIEKSANVFEKAAAIEELAGVFKEMNNTYLREALIDEACKRTGLDRAVFRGERKPVFQASAVRMPAPVTATEAAAKPQREELLLLRLAAEVAPARERLLAENVLSMLSSIELSETAQRWLEKIAEEEHVKAADWVDSWDDDETRPMLAGAFLEGIDVDTDWGRIWNDCLRKIIRREISRLLQKISATDTSGSQVDDLNRKIFELKQMEQGVNRAPKVEPVSHGRL